MKRLIKKILIRVLDPIATRLGYSKKLNIKPIKVHNYVDKNSLLTSFYEVLKIVGFAPEHIVDIGANHGNWTRQALKFFPEARYTLIEPQADLKKYSVELLEANPLITFHAVGAGNENTIARFTVSSYDDSSNFRYSETEADDAGLRQIDVPVVRLDSFLIDQGLPLPDLVKIDAEGTDLLVLDGANALFGKTEVFFVEAGIVNRIIDNSVLKVINFMDKKGYRLFDITDINRPYEVPVLWLTELAFIKKGGIIDDFQFERNRRL